MLHAPPKKPDRYFSDIAFIVRNAESMCEYLVSRAIPEKPRVSQEKIGDCNFETKDTDGHVAEVSWGRSFLTS